MPLRMAFDVESSPSHYRTNDQALKGQCSRVYAKELYCQYIVDNKTTMLDKMLMLFLEVVAQVLERGVRLFNR